MEQRVVPIFSRPVAIILKFVPPSHLQTLLQNNADAETNAEDQENNSQRTLLLRVSKCVPILPNPEASVFFRTSDAGLI